MTTNWTTKDKRIIPIPELKDDHLINLLKFIESKADRLYRQALAVCEDTNSVWEDFAPDSYKDLVEEANKRGLIWESIKLSDRTQIDRMISGALKTAILAHGPITLELVASASKRVIGALKSYNKIQSVVENSP